MIPTLFGITFVTFFVMQLAPGDPAELKFQGAGFSGQVEGEAGAAEAAIARFRKENLLDQPIWRQYLHYVGPFDLGPEGHPWFGGSGEHSWGGLMLGDLKHEFFRPTVPIREELGRRLAVTVPLDVATSHRSPSRVSPVARTPVEIVAPAANAACTAPNSPMNKISRNSPALGGFNR